MDGLCAIPLEGENHGSVYMDRDVIEEHGGFPVMIQKPVNTF